MSGKGIEPVRGAEAAVCVTVGDQLVGMGAIDVGSFGLEQMELLAVFLILSEIEQRSHLSIWAMGTPNRWAFIPL